MILTGVFLQALLALRRTKVSHYLFQEKSVLWVDVVGVEAIENVLSSPALATFIDTRVNIALTRQQRVGEVAKELLQVGHFDAPPEETSDGAKHPRKCCTLVMSLCQIFPVNVTSILSQLCSNTDTSGIILN